jgi:hypothetical protein
MLLLFSADFRCLLRGCRRRFAYQKIFKFATFLDCCDHPPWFCATSCPQFPAWTAILRRDLLSLHGAASDAARDLATKVLQQNRLIVSSCRSRVERKSDNASSTWSRKSMSD